MRDIKMCRNNSCLKYENCYRAQSAEHPLFQEWLNVTDNENCPFFIDIVKYHPAWAVDEYGTLLGRVTDSNRVTQHIGEDEKEDRIAWKLCKTSGEMQNCNDEWGSLPWEE